MNDERRPARNAAANSAVRDGINEAGAKNRD